MLLAKEDLYVSKKPFYTRFEPYFESFELESLVKWGIGYSLNFATIDMSVAQPFGRKSTRVPKSQTREW